MSIQRKLQFNLHLIDPNEIIFNSFNSYVYIDSPYILSYKCRLYVCSHGISIECNNAEITTADIIRIYYKSLSLVQSSNGAMNCNNLLLHTSSYILQYNNKQPWTFINNKLFQCTLQLSADDLSIVLQLINQCNMCCRISDTVEQNQLMNDIAYTYYSTIKFDITCIVDINEKSIININIPSLTNKSLMPQANSNIIYCNIIQPLLSITALCYITNKRIYTQSCSGLFPTQVYLLSSFSVMYKRRYAMKYSSIELIHKQSSNNSIVQSLYIQFQTNEQCNAVFIALKQYIAAPSTQSSLQQLLQQWHNKSIDNYTYLLQLNIISGRSFNDLSQYPVFPWLLNEHAYDADTLDLNDTSIYRDLSLPIGKLNESRFCKFKERYVDMQSHTTDHSHTVPPFLYGSFYSTLGYVLFYLVRQYPEWMLNLQHGVYDKSDRLFHSIQSTYNSVLTAPTDLKELIPQFYDINTNNNTAFLLNNYHINFGQLHDSTTVNDVILPRWCTSPAQFIQQMRAVLESDYVNIHLNQWIDLIFGVNAHGDGAIASDNVFYYLTYNISTDSTDTINQLNEFGQVPQQLFFTTHPQRNVAELNDDTIAPLITPTKQSHIQPIIPVALPVSTQQAAYRHHNNNSTHHHDTQQQITNTFTSTFNSAASVTSDIAAGTRSWMSSLFTKR